MMVFSIILATVILALILNFFRLVNKANVSPGTVFNGLKNDLTSGLFSFRKIKAKEKGFFRITRKFIYSFSVIIFFIMAISGFLLPLFWQQMDGFLLFIHVLVAPFFAISITIAIALFANNLQFNSEDYKYLTNRSKAVIQKIEYWSKIYFWLFAITVIFTIGSIVLAMYPLFGTPGQTWLLTIHRYSALALLVFTINYVTLKYSFKNRK